MAENIKALTDAVNGLVATVKTQGEQITQLKTLTEKNTNPDKRPALFGAPGVRKGENSLGSRGFSFLKMVGFIGGQLKAEEARTEVDLHNMLQKHLVQNTPYQKAETNSFIAPFSANHMFDNNASEGDRRLSAQVKEIVRAGVEGYDTDEYNWMLQRNPALGRSKAMSWLDEGSGGALVAPPVMGELIEIFRNNEALTMAGARDIGMPPSGRITYPRQTAAATAFWVGESTGVTESKPGTGDLLLTAKKLGVLVKIPNELYRFATVSAEAFVREDIAKVMALALDKQLLEGEGNSLKPKGLTTYANISNFTAGSPATNGDTYLPTDVGDMISVVEEKNATFNAWIMRPIMYTKLLNRRADAVTANDKAGPFLFNMFRRHEETMDRGRGVGSLEGYKCVKSTQVSNVRVKGSGTNLTYILGGDFTDFIMALGGVIEFLVANQGDSMVANDQTWIRGIHYVDGGPRHEASFVLCDNLLQA
jgi:HK97 family phage major capsid protein